MSGVMVGFSKGPFPYITDLAVDAEDPDSAATAYFKLTPGGTLETKDNLTSYVAVAKQWIPDQYAAVGTMFECRVSVTAGTMTGTTETWLALTSEQEFSKTQATVGTSSCTAVLKIGYAGNNSTLVKSTVVLNANRQA